jgi:predicted ATPase
MGLQRRGEALRLLGQWDEGTEQLRQGQEGYRATGASAGWSRGLTELARSCLHFGRYEEGLRLANEALQLTGRRTARYYEPEQHRIKGELLLLKSRASNFTRGNTPRGTENHDLIFEAEACFLKALELARSQNAKSWELRATTSLARLWQQRNKKHEARVLLGDLYNWFTEGFDTADLKDAKALMEELSS